MIVLYYWLYLDYNINVESCALHDPKQPTNPLFVGAPRLQKDKWIFGEDSKESVE